MSARATIRLDVRAARRLALARAALLAPELTGVSTRAAGRGVRARGRAHAIVERFGYLQLDSVAVAGARTHSIVLASRLDGFDAALGETLLAPGEPLFEYWGHEACWLPLSIYPWFGFRRRAYKVHPWWGDLLGEHRTLADAIVRRIEVEGPLRSVDLEGASESGWWRTKIAKRVAEALWSAGVLAIRERRGFIRSFDLTERVIPASVRGRDLDDADAFDALLLKALDGHGWATTGTLAATWRLVNARDAIAASLARLVERGAVVPCSLGTRERDIEGWIRPTDLELVPALEALRPRTARARLLSPFDPVLWDRARVRQLFGFEQILEIYKPAPQRQYGYYCLPVLAGDRLIARVDLKADRGAGTLAVRARHFERTRRSGRPDGAEDRAVGGALARFAASVGLEIEH